MKLGSDGVRVMRMRLDRLRVDMASPFDCCFMAQLPYYVNADAFSPGMEILEGIKKARKLCGFRVM